MHWIKKASTTAAIVVSATLLATPALAGMKDWDWSGIGDKTFDAGLLRPLQTIHTIGGFGLFIPAAIISSPGGTSATKDAWAYFVDDPAQEAFYRPLGEI